MVPYATRRAFWIVLSAAVLWMAAPAHQAVSAPSNALEALESAIIARTNLVRAQHGLGTVAYNGQLRGAARGHSEEMLRLDYFNHSSPTPGRKGVSERVFLTGATEVEVGENLAFYEGYGLDEIAERVVNDWMNSPGHRANLMKKSYNTIGVGVAYNGNKCLVTQVFASSRIALEPVSASTASGRVVVRLRGQVLSNGSELAVFDGRQAIERIPVRRGERFDVTVTLRANTGVHSVGVGLLEGNDGRMSTFAIYNVVPVNTSSVAAVR